MDKELLRSIFKEYNYIITVEENALIGGFGSAVSEFAIDEKVKGIKIHRLGLPDNFITHGDVEILFKLANIDPESIAEAILKIVKKEKKIFTIH